MDRHFIVEKESLVGIADALRAHGEVTRTIELPLVRKSSNAIDLDTYPTGWCTDADRFTETIFIEGATSVRVRGYVDGPAWADPDTGEYSHLYGGFVIDGVHYGRTYNTGGAQRFDVTLQKNQFDIGFAYFPQLLSSSGNQRDFYYVEFYGLNENGEQMFTYEKTLIDTDKTLTMAEMAEAIGSLHKAQDGDMMISQNGTYEVAGYRNAVVQVDNAPTEYVEVVVTADSETSHSIDLSRYIQSDDQMFSLAFTHPSSVDAWDKPAEWKIDFYHHIPSVKNNDVNLASITYSSSKSTATGLQYWPGNDDVALLYQGSHRGKFENGVFTLVGYDGSSLADRGGGTLGTYAILRYMV